MSKKENANQKLKKWMKHTNIETEDKNKPFFEGYKPNYYFNNLDQPSEEQIQELISKAILTGKDKYASSTSISKPLTLDDLEKWAEKLNNLPPSLIGMEIGSKYALDLLLKNIPTTQDINSMSYLNGISVSIVEGTDLKFNQAKFKYSDGSSKTMNIFDWEDK